MKLLFDLFPIILFFLAYHFGGSHPEAAGAMLAALGIPLHEGVKPGVFLATLVAIVATVLQVAWVKFRHGKVDAMLWVSFGLIVVFGGATLFLQNEAFIKWKPTVLYWLFAVSLAASPALFKKNLIRLMMEKSVALPDPVWAKLNLAWAVFFALMGVANLLVAFNFPTDTWVNFKLFGTLGLMLVFVIAQSLFLARHMKEVE